MTEKVSLQTRIYNLLQTRQFYWWLGHVIVVCNGTLYFSSVLSLNTNITFYKRAYLGALLSYAVVIYNSIGITHRSVSMDFLCDENVHYFVIAFYWYSYQPIAVTLIPFFIFSIFHTLSYFNSNIIPLIIPTTNDDNQDSKTKGPEIISKIDSNIQYFTDNYHTTAMQYVAYIEVIGILGRLVLGLLMFRTSVLALIVFVHFLRLRFFISSYTREALQTTTRYLDQFLQSTTTSDTNSKEKKNTYLQIISNIYISIKRLVIRYGGSNANTTSQVDQKTSNK